MNVRLASRLTVGVIIGVTLLSGCGSKNSLGFALNEHLIPTPDPLNLSGTGASHAGQMVAAENGYSGAIQATTTCSTGAKPVAQVSPLSGNAPLVVTVIPQNTGTCTITFSDSNGLTHTSTVNVTSSGIGVTSRSRQ